MLPAYVLTGTRFLVPKEQMRSGIADEAVPSIAVHDEDVVVAVPNADAEFVATHSSPNVLHRA